MTSATRIVILAVCPPWGGWLLLNEPGHAFVRWSLAIAASFAYIAAASAFGNHALGIALAHVLTVGVLFFFCLLVAGDRTLSPGRSITDHLMVRLLAIVVSVVVFEVVVSLGELGPFALKFQACTPDAKALFFAAGVLGIVLFASAKTFSMVETAIEEELARHNTRHREKGISAGIALTVLVVIAIVWPLIAESRANPASCFLSMLR